MRAIITVVGKDKVGILAAVATSCAQANANVVDVSQTVMDDYFTMTMMIEIDDLNTDFETMKQAVSQAVPEMQVHIMHENIFNSMHRI